MDRPFLATPSQIDMFSDESRGFSFFAMGRITAKDSFPSAVSWPCYVTIDEKESEKSVKE
jgi:hypothetical protein